MNRKLSVVICAAVVGAALLQSTQVDAQAANKDAQTNLGEAITEIRIETVQTRDQLQATVDSLNKLVKQESGDLRPGYEAYSADVEKTHDAQVKTSSRIGAMQTASKDYFGTWQDDVASISNADLRKRAQRRLDDVRKSYDKVVGSLKQAAEQFKPFLSNLDDIDKTLANDITAGGIKAVRGTASDATWNEKKVLRYINEAIDELYKMEKALSPQKGG